MSKSFVKVQFKNDYANDYAGKEYEFGTYKKLAEHDPEMKKLVQEFENLE